MTFFLPTSGAITDSAVTAARAHLDAQQRALALAQTDLEAACDRLPRSSGAIRGVRPWVSSTSSGDAPWKGPARRAFDDSLFDLESAAIDARDALVIAERFTRLAREGLAHAD